MGRKVDCGVWTVDCGFLDDGWMVRCRADGWWILRWWDDKMFGGRKKWNNSYSYTVLE